MIGEVHGMQWVRCVGHNRQGKWDMTSRECGMQAAGNVGCECGTRAAGNMGCNWQGTSQHGTPPARHLVANGSCTRVKLSCTCSKTQTAFVITCTRVKLV